MVHYYEYHNEGFDFYADYLIKQAEFGNFTYGAHLAPHDIQVKEMNGRTRIETARDAGIEFRVVPKIGIADGINNVRTILPICYFDEQGCEEGIDHLKKYRKEWDSKRGVWKNTPRHDEHSHGCLRGDSLVLMADGTQKEIRHFKIGDMVKTPHGSRKVLNAGISKYTDELYHLKSANGHELHVTGEHKIFTDNGLELADTLSNFTNVIDASKGNFELWKKISSSLKTENLSYRQMVITGRITGERNMENAICTEPYGNITMGQYLKIIISTIEMEISLIMTSQILNACPNMITYPYQQNKVGGLVAKKMRHSLEQPVSLQKSGILALKELHGIARTEKNAGRTERLIQKIVSIVTRNIKHIIQVTQNSVPTIANQDLEGMENLTIKSSTTARNADLNLQEAEITTELFATTTRLISKEKYDCQLLTPVYDLTVDKDHCYFANGLLVSNSDAFRYLANGHTFDLGASGVFARQSSKQRRQIVKKEYV